MAAPTFGAGTAYATIRPELAKDFHQRVKQMVEKKQVATTVRVDPKLGPTSEFKKKLTAAMAKTTGNVKVTPTLAGVPDFKRELKTAIANIDQSVKITPVLGSLTQLKQDLRAKSGTLPNLKVGVDLDFTQARAQLAAFRAATPDLHLNLNLDSAAASAQLAALIAQAMALRGALNGIDIPAGGIKGASSAMSGLASAAGPALMALMALSAVNLVPLVGQLVQAAGAVSLIPAGAAAAAASLATVVIGGNGVMDAFKAAGEAATSSGQAATSSAKQQRAAARQVEDAERAVADARENAAWTAKDGARQIASAERQVEDAQKRSKAAQEDLTRARKDAQQQIEDLNFALKGSAIDEEDALIAVERARERLRNLGKDGQPVTALDVREAQNSIRSAVRRVDEVRRRNAELREETDAANRAGVEGAQQVVDAREAAQDAAQGEIDAMVNLGVTQEQVARSNAQAQRQIEDALRRVADAQEAQAEATTASAGGVDKLAEAMAKLSPNAQDFVNKVRDLGGAWTDVRKQIQDSLFDGLGTSIQKLANTYLPTLRIGLGGIATEINGGLKRAISDLTSESTKLDWATIFENTRRSIGPLIDGVSSLAGAFTNIATVGSEFLESGATSFAETMQRFEDWTNSSEGQQAIRDFMEKSIESLKQLKDLFLAVGDVVGALFTSSEENGQSMIESMTEQLREWADWIRENPDRMKQFWDDAQQTAKDMLALVGKAIELADKVAALTGNRFGLTNGQSGKVDENGNPVASDGETGVIGRTWFFPGVKEDSWFGRLLGGGDDGEESASGAQEGGVPSVGGTPLNGANLQSALKDQIAAGNTEGGSFLGQLGDPEVWGQKWTTFSDSVSKGWNEKVWPSLQGTKDKAWEIGQGFVDDVQTRAGDAWNGLRTGVSDGWTSIQGVWQTLRTEGLGGLANEFTSKITNGAVTSWKDLPSHIMGGVGDIINTHFPGLSNGLSTLQGWFQIGVDAIGRLWDGLREKLRGPINFVIREVYNNGIAKFWNMVGPKIGLGTLDPITEIPAFNKGGTVDGVMSGYSPGVDDRIIAVGGGEAVMRPEWTKAVGKDFVDQANAVARGQGVEGVRKFMGGFSGGGVVESIVKLVNENFPMMDITSTHRSTNDLHGQGKAVDFSNGYDTTPEMQDAARFFHDNYGSRLAELIHYPLNGWQNIDEGQPFNFGEPTNSQHRNHVHVAAHEPLIPMTEEEKGFFAKIAGAVGGVVSRVSNVFRNMAADLFEKPLNGLGSLIPDQFEGIGDFGRIPKALYNTMKDKLINFVRGKAGEKDGSEGGNTPFDISAGAEQWRDTVLKALEMTGHDASEADIVLKQIQIESGGNPNAINDWDINAQNGTPSKGLIQTIDPTFQAYRDPSLPDNPYDPLANLVAGIRYADATYGDIKNIWPKTMGYDAGGILPDDAMALNTSGKPEAVFTHDEWRMLQDFARLIGRPDFIQTLKGIEGGPEELPKDPAVFGNTTLPYGTQSPYSTGTGIADANPEMPWYLTADPAGSLAGRAGNLAQSQLQGWGEYFKSSWPEMLETAVGLAGVGALNGGGMTINGNVGMGPKELAAVHQRNEARNNRAAKRSVLGR